MPAGPLAWRCRECQSRLDSLSSSRLERLPPCWRCERDDSLALLRSDCDELPCCEREDSPALPRPDDDESPLCRFMPLLRSCREPWPDWLACPPSSRLLLGWFWL